MSLIQDLLVFGCAFLGGGFLLVASIGILRFPDLFTRMHAASKSGTLGVGFLLAAVIFERLEVSVTFHALIVFLFLIITAPVGVHMLARAALVAGVALDGRYEGEAPPGLGGRADDAARHGSRLADVPEE